MVMFVSYVHVRWRVGVICYVNIINGSCFFFLKYGTASFMKGYELKRYVKKKVNSHTLTDLLIKYAWTKALFMQISSHPMAWQRFNGYAHLKKVKATWWISLDELEWGRKLFKPFWMPPFFFLVLDRRLSVCNKLIYTDFNAKQSVGFTENCQKKSQWAAILR